MQNQTKLNSNQITIIKNLRAENYSYASIASQLDLSLNTVKSYCRRHGIETPSLPRKSKAEKSQLQICKNCGKPIENPWNRKVKTFCSQACRTAFWNREHLRTDKKAADSCLQIVQDSPLTFPADGGMNGPGGKCLWK